MSGMQCFDALDKWLRTKIKALEINLASQQKINSQLKEENLCLKLRLETKLPKSPSIANCGNCENFKAKITLQDIADAMGFNSKGEG